MKAQHILIDFFDEIAFIAECVYLQLGGVDITVFLHWV